MAVETGTENREATEAQLERVRAERDALRARLIEAEQQLAELPGLRADREELGRLRASPSWRITAPLRALSHWARRQPAPRLRLAFKGALARLAARARG
jgi:hypothetical protein